MLSSLILTTKLYPPALRADRVARPRLVDRLNAGLEASRPLILISATAGFGKTTLASEWITECQLEPSTAWISLDEDDNNPVQFFIYLIAALQQVDAQIGENLLPVLQSHQPVPMTELAAQLINQIAASEKKVLLVLDDYHLITSEAVHQMVQLIVERGPNQMHTLLLTREDPPFALPRMRVRGQVLEIRERDLRFNQGEAEGFLVEAMMLDLSADDVGKLKERTEGWVAGMQLAALALEEYPDPAGRSAFIQAFAGSDRFIVDYLVSEVLERQSEAVRQFLLSTSILERFCADLCDQVVYGEAGSGRSQPILDRLEQGNMFLVPLDNQRQWYRYHHLFGEMLEHSLRRSAPDHVPELYRRASEWFETKGFVPEAVKYGLASRDWDFAGALLDRHAMEKLLQGQGSLVIGWCQALPKETLERSPEICIYTAWALALTFRKDFLEAVEEKLQLAERAIEQPDLPSHARVGQGGTLVPLRDWVVGQSCVIRSQIILGRFNTVIDPQELIALSLKGLELLPEVEKAIRAICKINLAHAQLMQSHPGEAQQALEQALPFMLEANNFLGGVTSIFYQARLAYTLGELERAETLCQQWKAKFAEMSGLCERDLPAVRGLDIVLSLLLMERNRLDEAELLLDHALELLGWASWMELHGFITLARLRFLRGDHAGAEKTLQRMARLGPQHASCAEALQILFGMRTSPEDPQVRVRAEKWVTAHSPDTNTPNLPLGIGPYHCDVEYLCNLTWAQVQILLGKPQDALPYLEMALGSARDHHLPHRVVELGLARALAQEGCGDHAAAAAELIRAHDLAAQYGYVRVFDDGAVLERMLAVKSGAGPVHFPSPRKEAIRPALVEPLSPRELEVLHLIAAGCSNGQIGERLYIAQGTVKRHITNLYGKLAVQSRTQAIARAREIGLLA